MSILTPSQVYTFGAPRVGNHAFAREFNEKVPELWNVINDQVSAGRSQQLSNLQTQQMLQ